MKKIATIFAISLLIASFGIPSAYSVKYTILVGNNFFNPANLTGVNAGDTIHWQWSAGNHTTTSTTIPAGAATWDEPINSSNQSYEYIPTVGGVYNYKCTPHAAMGMLGSFTVTAAAPLSVSASSEPSAVCLGQHSILSSFPEGGTGSYTFAWTSDPPGFTSNQQNVEVTPSQTTEYTVTVTSGAQTASASATVTVQNPATAMAVNDTTYCDNIASFPVSGMATNYSSVLWTTTGDGTFAFGNTLDDIYTPGTNDIASGSVDLVFHAIAIAPCSANPTDTVHVTFVLCTGIGNKTGNTISLSVFPNPSSGTFTLRTGNISEPATLKIFDMQGRIVFTENLKPGMQGDSGAINVSGLTSGVYQITVVSGKNTGTARILIR